jgi:hypothetical protein
MSRGEQNPWLTSDRMSLWRSSGVDALVREASGLTITPAARDS